MRRRSAGQSVLYVCVVFRTPLRRPQYRSVALLPLSEAEYRCLVAVVTGVAAGFMAPAGLSIITSSFAEGSERNRALLIYAGVGAAGFDHLPHQCHTSGLLRCRGRHGWISRSASRSGRPGRT